MSLDIYPMSYFPLQEREISNSATQEPHSADNLPLFQSRPKEKMERQTNIT